MQEGRTNLPTAEMTARSREIPATQWERAGPLPYAPRLQPRESAEPRALPANFPKDELTQGLRYLGFIAHEAQTYSVLARLGPCTAGEVISQSKLDRATGYRMLSRLRARGVVSIKGFRPQLFVALEPARLFERLIDQSREELELRRLVRQAYAVAYPTTQPSNVPSSLMTGPSSAPMAFPTVAPASVPLSLLPGHDQIGRYVVERLGEAKKEICALVRPRSLPKAQRTELIRTMVGRLKEGVPIRLVFDYHPSEIEFLTEILRLHPDALGTLMVRFYALQFARLFAVDQRVAVRWLASPSGTNRDPELGVASDHGEFVRSQMARFENTWRGGVPIEQALSSPRGSIIAPPTCSRELRRALEQLADRAMLANGGRPAYTGSWNDRV